MFKNIKHLREFDEKVQLLLEPHLVERGIHYIPDCFFGSFFPWRIEEVLSICRDNPEIHIVTCVKPRLYVNGFIDVRRCLNYYLGEGDRDPQLIYDPLDQFDEQILRF